MADLDAMTLARFWSKVDVGNPADCWPWRAQRNNRGYGAFQDKKAHRVAFELLRGNPVPAGMMVCHRCDNPPCCNPHHMFLGAQIDNVHDMIAKGRGTFGERHPNAKLTDAQVAEIRASKSRGIDLARLYGVSEGTISSIRSFKHRRVSAQGTAQVAGNCR